MMIAGNQYRRRSVKVMANYLNDASMEAIASGEAGEGKKPARYVLLNTVYKSVTARGADFDFWLFIGDGELDFDRCVSVIRIRRMRINGELNGFAGVMPLLGYKHVNVWGGVQQDTSKNDDSVAKLMRDLPCGIEYDSIARDLGRATISDLHEYSRLDELEPGTALSDYDVEPPREWVEFVRKAAKASVEPMDDESVPSVSDLVSEQAAADGVVDESHMQALIDRVNNLPLITCPENRAVIIEQLERAVRLLKDVDESYAEEKRLIADLKDANDRLERLTGVLKQPWR